MRRVILANENYYHVFNRGVEKRTIFLDDEDYERFYQSLYLFNDSNYRNPGNQPLHNESLLAGHEVLKEFRNPFVSIISFCLMPNHFHLYLLQLQDEGISKFLHKLQLGYGHYFNRKYGRTGRLFASTFKAVHIERDEHAMHLPRYIHMNALDRAEPAWREGKVKDWSQAREVLDAFQWSSHSVYLGKEQELPVVDVEVLKFICCSPNDYGEFLSEWATREMPCNLVTSDVT